MSSNRSQSPSHKRLSALREELAKIQSPSYPDELSDLIKEWAMRAIPTIKQDYADHLDEFQKITDMGYASQLQMDKIAYGTYGSEQNFRASWEEDNKNAMKKQRIILSFVDGLLLLG